MTSPSHPAIVICHGSYHTPAPYEPLIKALRARGIEAYCPQLPTADLSKLNVGDIAHPDFDRAPPPGGYPQASDDAKVIIDLLHQMINAEGKSVLLVGHSAGGWVATEAARPKLQMRTRRAEGKAGGVIGIFFMGAFIIPVGESVNSFFQPKDGNFVTPPFLEFHKHGAAGLGTIKDASRFLFNDLDAAEAQKWAKTLTASPILTTRLTNDAYAALPCAYLVLEGDQTLPKQYQEGMVAAQSQRSGKQFTMYYCPAGHSPHLSWTEGLVGKLDDFIATAMA